MSWHLSRWFQKGEPLDFLCRKDIDCPWQRSSNLGRLHTVLHGCCPEELGLGMLEIRTMDNKIEMKSLICFSIQFPNIKLGQLLVNLFNPPTNGCKPLQGVLKKRMMAIRFYKKLSQFEGWTQNRVRI